MADDPVLANQHSTFRQERESFMARYNAQEPEAVRLAWQRHYFVGQYPDGEDQPLAPPERSEDGGGVGRLVHRLRVHPWPVTSHKD